MADSPNIEKGVVRCSVFSGGEAVGAAFRLVSVHIEKGVGKIGRAKLVYKAGDMPSASVPESDDDTFAIGTKVRIEAGYGDDEAPIFEGVVISHGVEIGQGNDGLLRIECRDHAFAMTQGRRSCVFVDSSDSDAIKAIAGNYPSLTATVTATATKYGELTQYYSTDWDFVRSLASRNGMVIRTEGAQITIDKPDISSEPVLTITYGPDIISFQGDVSAEGQVANISASAWDAAQQKNITGKSHKPSLNAQGSDDATELGATAGMKEWSLQTVGMADTDALAAWADAWRLRAGMSRIQGKVTFAGSAAAVAGTMIELDGFGKHFNGEAYIGAVEHIIRDGGWETVVHMGLPEEETISMASGLLPPTGGLHIGKMVKPDGDPAKNGRVQIEIPTLNGENNVVWARLASPWASKDYGSFIVPDAGDEVIVGFFNDDPCYPVILGSLFSSARKAPYELAAENDIHALVTREKIRAVFNDKDKSLTIETPGSNRLVLSDKDKGIALSDQNGNKLTMNDSGITLESSKALNIKSGTEIAFKAGTAASLQASTDMKIKGLNVEVKADASLKAQGTASSEFSASGPTTVKGAVVMIN